MGKKAKVIKFKFVYFFLLIFVIISQYGEAMSTENKSIEPLKCKIYKTEQETISVIGKIFIDRERNETSPPIPVDIDGNELVAACFISEEQTDEQITCGFFNRTHGQKISMANYTATFPFRSSFIATNLNIGSTELMIYCVEKPI